MRTPIITTEFAPAERVPIEIVHRQAASLAESKYTIQVLHSVLNFVFILNPQRQIVFASRNWERLLPGKAPADLLGQRPGEVLGCVHSTEHPGGCGTSAFCQECGAVKAILASLAGKSAVHECRLTRLVDCREQALDLLVYGSPFPVDGETYCLLTVLDISHENRRRALERIFFHDVLNASGGLEALAGMLQESVPEALREDMAVLQDGLHDLHEQVQTQRDLAAAEHHELKIAPVVFDPGTLLREVVGLYRKHLAAQHRHLQLAGSLEGLALTSDPDLLRRILGNLVKNALEAARAGQTVTVGGEDAGHSIRLWVHNPGYMPKAVQLQVFSRSFSTKGLGRGLGTYSVRLLTERYLKGRASFTTDPEHGTTFSITLPKTGPEPSAS
ncbi:MAG: PAS domain-containing sensor histidine kinase [Verrucomicrobia bacterium]|nr:PAS domain-containing sensor histidine kinase [Verrucomicrobiota bacterium]